MYVCDKGNNFLRATPGGDASRVIPWSSENFSCEALSVAHNVPNGRYCLLHHHQEKLTSRPTHCGRVSTEQGGEIPNFRVNGVLPWELHGNGSWRKGSPRLGGCCGHGSGGGAAPGDRRSRDVQKPRWGKALESLIALRAVAALKYEETKQIQIYVRR